MSDTNDPQAPYGKNREAFGKIMDDALAKAEATERAPLLSDDDLLSMIPTRFDAVQPKPNGMSMQGCKAVRDFYEAKITSGELRVVKAAEIAWWSVDKQGVHHGRCGCGHMIDWNPILSWNFCPGCGAQIVK